MLHLFIIIFLLCICASFIQRTTGFGFGVFIMTVLPYLMPSYGEATTLSGLLAMSNSLVICMKMRRYLDFSRLLPILLTFICVSSFAIFCLKRMDDNLLHDILGVTLILVSIYFIFFSNRIKIPANKKGQFTAGTISGLMGGFFGAQGPPAVLYFISTTKDKNQYMSMMQSYLLCGNIMMTMVRAYNGFLTPTVGWDYLYGIGGVAVGTTLGAYVFQRIPNKKFKYVVYCYIGISGIIMLIV